MEKVTYASLSAVGEEFHRAYESALTHERKKLGHVHPLVINGKAVKSKAGTFDRVCPANTGVLLGRFQKGTREHVRQAIAAAKEAGHVWRELGWRGRVAFLRKAAEVMARHQAELAALLSLEVGKTRVEAMAEVCEAIDLVHYYCAQVERNYGYAFRPATAGPEETQCTLRPYGVWGVVSAFNFPLALPTGMATAALLGGNTVVFKPSSRAPLSGLRLCHVLHDAGMPVGICNVVTGAGEEVGTALVENPDVDGLVFTGARATGLGILRRFSQERPRPCIVEMGGKNPCLIMPSANLEDAVEGVVRSAFALGGQKSSACSRVYVHQKVARPFYELLGQRTQALKIGDPTASDTFLGPLISRQAVVRFQQAVALGKKEGRLLAGGNALTKGEFANGYYVEPTLVNKLPKDARLLREEFFTPVLALAEVGSLDEAITLANDSAYGLSAGIFTAIHEEQIEFFNRIEAGVAYCNRRGGATTGAWPGVQSFGGWKDSGSSGKNALGPYYVPLFLREQSQTIAKPH